ncbi:6,7-dimethyl-8-ribityllumazine synthase [Porphyromonas circumdentaria]|uniref:6,7-dimethyl-8-ribityllumazine synthase n=1 Tax=Porphyromonas circumdentaria TaxID=29524 RepID=A0A1T4P0H1_9PORP|nr:6,7-dimethyl-8-ribityllumazine synthase [Porphyromonas circumdentaria]MBB6276258.1 6,7-dimethyl-8-ribityllumazine synthase [Porphyromonas circumdentaria]MDO4722270.1 6,7-dimethyl-8-ribityllumazine synthase [Porphyromonas circumdentaria]SJZ84931.1 6,7-dimethyl-8-ribityllumazine synthase [Porphyromonas circumdentaria]
MSTLLHNLSEGHYKLKHLATEEVEIAIAVADWNSHITHKLLEGALEVLHQSGIKEKQIKIVHVPGAFELTYAAAAFLQTEVYYDAVIILGCVIRGDTSHYDHICDGVTYGITSLNRNASSPVIFGLITTENEQQALDRAGGALGNKGAEAAITALKMIDTSCEIHN